MEPLKVNDVLVNENDSSKTLTIKKITKSRKVTYQLDFGDGEVVKNVSEKKDKFGYYQTYKRVKYYKNKLDTPIEEPPPPTKPTYQAPAIKGTIDIEEIGGLGGDIFQNIMKFTTFNEKAPFEVGDILYPMEKSTSSSRESGDLIKVIKAGKTLTVEKMNGKDRKTKAVKTIVINGKPIQYIPYDRQKYTKYQNFTNFPSLSKSAKKVSKSAKPIQDADVAEPIADVAEPIADVAEPIKDADVAEPIAEEKIVEEDLDKLVEDFFPLDELEEMLDDEELNQLYKDTEKAEGLAMGREDVNVGIQKPSVTESEEDEFFDDEDDFFDDEDMNQELEKERMASEDIDAKEREPVAEPVAEPTPPPPPPSPSVSISSAEESSQTDYDTDTSVEKAYDKYREDTEEKYGNIYIEGYYEFEEKYRRDKERSRMAEEDVNIKPPPPPIEEEEEKADEYESVLEAQGIEEETRDELQFFELANQRDLVEAMYAYTLTKNEKYYNSIKEYFKEGKLLNKTGKSLRKLLSKLDKYTTDDENYKKLVKKIDRELKPVIKKYITSLGSQSKTEVEKRINYEGFLRQEEIEKERKSQMLLKKLQESAKQNIGMYEGDPYFVPENYSSREEPKVAEPVAEVAEPVAEVAEPVAEVAEPVAEVAEPVAEVAEPVAEVAEPVAEVAEPMTESEKEDLDAIKQVEEFLRLEQEEKERLRPKKYIPIEIIGRIRKRDELQKSLALLNYFENKLGDKDITRKNYLSWEDGKFNEKSKTRDRAIIRSVSKSLITYAKNNLKYEPINLGMGVDYNRGVIEGDDRKIFDEAIKLKNTLLKPYVDKSYQVVKKYVDIEKVAVDKIKSLLGKSNVGAFNNIQQFIYKDPQLVEFDKASERRKNIEEIQTTKFLMKEGLYVAPKAKPVAKVAKPVVKKAKSVSESEDSDADYVEDFYDE